MAPDAPGYRSRRYATSLAAVGTPRELPRSGGWILEREIAGTVARDGVSVYPLLVLSDWTKLSQDLAGVGDSLVSLVVVTDPFGGYTEPLLHECFPDRVLAFKEHFVVDCEEPGRTWVSTHHRRNVRKAHALVRADVCSAAEDVLDDWAQLYDALVRRHDIQGPAAFSREAFALQLSTPGIVVLRATSAGRTVGMLLWFVRDDIAYYHLGAYTAKGSAARASYALMDLAIEYFTGKGLRWLDLGGGAGLGEPDAGELERFKRGWANSTRMAYLCGRIFDRPAFERLVDETGTWALEPQYFPAYRAREPR